MIVQISTYVPLIDRGLPSVLRYKVTHPPCPNPSIGLNITL